VCWGEPLIVKREEFSGDPFDRPRQVSVLGYNQHDGYLLRFDSAALAALHARYVADVQLRIVLRYGGVLVRRFTLPELDVAIGRIRKRR
jgi:hypothetical protein